MSSALFSWPLPSESICSNFSTISAALQRRWRSSRAALQAGSRAIAAKRQRRGVVRRFGVSFIVVLSRGTLVVECAGCGRRGGRRGGGLWFSAGGAVEEEERGGRAAGGLGVVC